MNTLTKKQAIKTSNALPNTSIEQLLKEPLPELFLEHRKRTGKKITGIAADTGFDLNSLYKWRGGTKPSDVFDYIKLVAYLKGDTKLQKYISTLIPVVAPLGSKELIEYLGGEGTCQIKDESMQPTFKQGCTIVVQEVKDRNLLMWGEYYLLVDLNNQAIVRRVYQSDDHKQYQLVSLNEENYPKIHRELFEVVKIYSIKSVITRM